MYSLSNDLLSIVVAPKGAELQSIYHKGFELEYMWSADPAYWAKKSPVLFPIVGNLKSGAFRFEDRQYIMGRHGFARDSNFELTEQTDTSLTFSIQSNEMTVLQYPFHFKFSVKYTLKESKLTISYIVENTDHTQIYFSVGGHPAFKVPLVEGTNYEDYFIEFEEEEHEGIWPLSAEGLLLEASVPFLNGNIIPLTKNLFYKDALVFKNLLSQSVSLKNNKTKHGLTIRLKDFPYLGIWAAKNADFVCIEPWCGIADNVNASGDITEKEGINVLAVGEIFTKEFSVTLF